MSKSTFADPAFAIKLRDIIRKIVKDEVQRLRPAYQLGVVHALNDFTGKADVIFPGESKPVVISYGSTAPQVGQVVRVAGSQTDRFIQDVLGATVDSGSSAASASYGRDFISLPVSATTAGVNGWQQWGSIITIGTGAPGLSKVNATVNATVTQSTGTGVEVVNTMRIQYKEPGGSWVSGPEAAVSTKYSAIANTSMTAAVSMDVADATQVRVQRKRSVAQTVTFAASQLLVESWA